MRENLGLVGLIAVMLLVGGVGWWFQLRPPLRVDPSHLLNLPMTLEGWEGVRIPVEDAVERILEADFNLQRRYRSPDGNERIWLYVGYYGTHRGGNPEHTPAECYPSAGWAIESERTVTLDPERNFRVNEYIVSRDTDRRLVYFWYRSHRSTGMLDHLSLSLDRMRGRLSGGRSDGALVRVSTPFPPDGDASTRERLSGFARRLDPLLDTYWPVEFPAS